MAALMTAVVTYGWSAASKLRGGSAYRAFRDGLAATKLVSAQRTGTVAATLVAAETAVASLCAAALIMSLLTRPGAPATFALRCTALACAAALTAVLTAGVATVVRRGVTAPCACFGSRGASPLSAVHVTRNACLLAVLIAGVTGLAAAGPDGWRPGAAAAILAVAIGGVAALLLTRLDDLTALFGTGTAAR